jgi:hypothetical protein
MPVSIAWIGAALRVGNIGTTSDCVPRIQNNLFINVFSNIVAIRPFENKISSAIRTPASTSTSTLGS